jgi:transposase
MQCPKCKQEDHRKAGFIQEKPRYECRQCGCKYTRSTPKGKGPEVHQAALKLYLSGVSLKRIGELLGVSTPAVLKWIRKQRTEEANLKPGKATVVELDELCTFLLEKNAKSGYGLLFVERLGESLRGSWVVEELIH